MNTCQNCRLKVMDTELVEIEDLKARVAPGEPMPSGQCPECGSLCRADRPEIDNEWLERLRVTLNDIEHGMETLRNLVIEIDAPASVFAVGGIFAQTFGMFKKTLSEEVGLVLMPESYMRALTEAVLEAAEIPEDAEEIVIDSSTEPDEEDVSVPEAKEEVK